MKKESVYFFWEKEGKRSGSQARLNGKTEFPRGEGGGKASLDPVGSEDQAPLAKYSARGCGRFNLKNMIKRHWS